MFGHRKDLKTKIELSIHCGTPMVQTLMFSGAEFYCVVCGETQGIFGTRSIEETTTLLHEMKKNERYFVKIAADCIPSGSRFPECEKCNSENHNMHASKEDLDKSDSAYLALRFGIA